MRRIIPVALYATAMAFPLAAGAQALSVAVSQAPEQSWGIGFGDTPEAAIARATAACVEGGAEAPDCLLTNLCHPSGWTITVGVMHVEGLHWSETYCGLPERETALRLYEAVCDLSVRPWLSMCELAVIHDPSGAAEDEH